MATKPCRKCGRFELTIDDSRVCDNCKQAEIKRKRIPSLKFFINENDLCAPARVNTGTIIDRELWMHVKREVDKFFRYTNDEEIDNFNSWKKLSNLRKKQQTGYIYLLRSSNGYYKIGRTKDLDSRLGNYTHDYPVKMTLLHSVKVSDYIKAETYLLSIFSHCRLRGEWHELDKEQIDWIKSLDTNRLEDLIQH